MQEFLDYVLRQLIDFPDEMVLTRLDAPKKSTFRLRLRKSDIGKVIGKHGQTIIALRNLLAAGAARHGERAYLEILEDAPAARAWVPPGAAREAGDPATKPYPSVPTDVPDQRETSEGSGSQSSDTDPNLR